MSARCSATSRPTHAAFVRTFSGLKAEFDRTGPTATLATRVQQEIVKWITGHFVGVDVKLRPCGPAAVRA